MQQENFAIFHACNQKWRGTRISTCADCGTKFSYRMERLPEGYGLSESKAEEKALKELNRSLEYDVDLVRCPVCGRFQAGMIAQKRKINKGTVIFLLVLWLVACAVVGWFAGYNTAFWLYTTRYVFAGMVAILLMFHFRVNCASYQSASSTTTPQNINRDSSKEVTIITSGQGSDSQTNTRTPSAGVFTGSVLLFVLAIIFALGFLTVPANNVRNFQIVWGITAIFSVMFFALALLSNSRECKKLEEMAGPSEIDDLVFVQTLENGEEEIDPQ